MQIFSQTRGGENLPMSLKDVILNPMASFGGLYTLSYFPPLPPLSSLLPLSYAQLTQTIFQHLQLDLDKLPEALNRYNSFDTPLNPAPTSHLYAHCYLQELYHGPSRSFKDMALQPLGKLFSSYAQGEKYLILTATSGDTGPATLQAFQGMDHVFVACLYPAKGTSDVQRLQMSTQDSPNLKVLPIIGNFDDAQHSLKTLIQDPSFLSFLNANGFKLSVSNSVNFGRIAFQIIYHIWGYLDLVKKGEIKLGEEIYSVIPSGNFGNALGAFYAKWMGLPCKKIIIASNANHILTDFIQSGIYDISCRTLLQTLSPAMDILKSSNIERMLFTLFGSEQTKQWMESLNTHKLYTLNQEQKSKMQTFFDADFCSDTECLQTLKELAQKGLILDPHTANAYAVAKKLPKSHKILIASTAEWSKFSPTIAYAISKEKWEDQKALDFLSLEFNLSIPKGIQSLFSQQEKSSKPIEIQNIQKEIMDWLS